jgi:hypothetical protein
MLLSSKWIRRFTGLLGLLAGVCPVARAADVPTPSSTPGPGDLPPPVTLTAQQGHQMMMDLLHITSLRPGANQSAPQSPNGVNYDESKANPYPKLPDPLVLKNGQKVTTPEQWWSERRPEIVEDFDREIYGRVPANTPKVTWEVTSRTMGTMGSYPIVTKQLVGQVDNASYPYISVNIQVTLITPANAPGPVPVIMQFVAGGPPPPPPVPNADEMAKINAALKSLLATADPQTKDIFDKYADYNPLPLPPGGNAGARGGTAAPAVNAPPWQEQLLAKGWGAATISTTSIQADNSVGLSQGIIGLMNKGQPRKPDDWGVLRAWAWGASRALDYFATDKDVDAKQVGLEGHSRWGKATIIAMAYDQRFAIAYVSSSGEGGVKLHRRNFGELVENLAAGEYYWMAGNFMKYAGPLTWDDLPVDAHELIALCAPRPVFVGAGGNGDNWADPRGMFMAVVAAGPVYTLLGKKDLGTTEYPAIQVPLIDGDLGFRVHEQGHTDVPNWPTFITFASRYLKAPTPQN